MKNPDRSTAAICAAIAVAAPHHAYAEEPSGGSVAEEASPRQLKSLRDLADECRMYIDAIRSKIKHPGDEMPPEDTHDAFRRCSLELIGLRGSVHDLYRALYERLSLADDILRLSFGSMSRSWSRHEDSFLFSPDIPYDHELDSDYLQRVDVQPLLEQLAEAEAFLSRLEVLSGESPTTFCLEDLEDNLKRFDELGVLIRSLELRSPKLLGLTEWDQAKRTVNGVVTEERERVRRLLDCKQPVAPVVPPRTTGDRGSSDKKK